MSIDDNKTAIDLWQIIANHGYANQKEKTIEELGELSRALCRYLSEDRPRPATVVNVCEETADVTIMLEQLRMIFPTDQIDAWEKDKLLKLAARVGDVNEESGEAKT